MHTRDERRVEQTPHINAPSTDAFVNHPDGEGVERRRVDGAEGFVAVSWTKLRLFSQHVETQVVVLLQVGEQTLVQADKMGGRLPFLLLLGQRRCRTFRLSLFIIAGFLFLLSLGSICTTFGIFGFGGVRFFVLGGKVRRLFLGIPLRVVPFLFQLTQQPTQTDF